MNIHMSTLGASVLVLVFAAIAHFGLRWYAQRRCRLKEEKASPTEGERERSARRWLAQTVLELIAPVALLLWIQGLHYALSLLLTDVMESVDTRQWPLVRYAPATLEALHAVATIVALIWLLARLGRAIEARLVTFARESHTRSDDFFLPIVVVAIRLLLPLLAVTM